MHIAAPHPTPHLILGGARSGKSTYAESLTASLPPPYVYLATAQVLDDEMDHRVCHHQARRGAPGHPMETPILLVETLRDLQGGNRPVLLDCLTLWLTNLLLHPSAPDPEREVQALCSVIATVDFPLIIVSNEVGGGIVPENALARRFRDLAGSANQKVAAVCRSVTVVMAGLPLTLK